MIGRNSIALGDEMPALQRLGTVDHWSRFAAVNYEFAEHHWDDEVARSEGFAAAFAMAPLQHSFLHALLRDWIGEAGRIVEVDIKLKTPFLRGRVLTASGRVTAIRHEQAETFVDCELWEIDDTGTEIARGTATIALDR